MNRNSSGGSDYDRQDSRKDASLILTKQGPGVMEEEEEEEKKEDLESDR